MATLLDRLGDRLWLVWVTCFGWAAVVVFYPAAAELIELPLGICLFAIWFLALSDFRMLRSEARKQPTVDASEFHPVRDRTFVIIACLSATMVVAQWTFDLDSRLSLPLVLGMIVPLALRNRGDLRLFMTSRQSGA